MFPDFKEFLSSLNRQNVRYLVVGGYAVSLHAQPRDRRHQGRGFHGARPVFRMGRTPVMVDILSEISGVDFDAAWQRREAVIDPETGLKGSFISREDLITAKLAAGRPQDMADVDALRKAVSER